MTVRRYKEPTDQRSDDWLNAADQLAERRSRDGKAMSVVVNAISIKEGGSLVVLEELLARMCHLDPSAQWAMCIHPSLRQRFEGRHNVSILAPDWIDRGPGALAYFYHRALPQLVHRASATVVFSQTNYLPLRRLGVPTLLLIQNAGHFSVPFAQLTEASSGVAGRCAWRLKSRWVDRSARTADLVTVQTHALATDITQQLGIDARRLRVIPHGPGIIEQSGTVRDMRRGDEFRIGYITKFGVQKNFAVVFQALAILRQRDLPVRLTLTLHDDAHRSDRFQTLAPLIEELGVSDLIDNHGEVPWQRLRPLYDGLDLFVFPSICESFGFPLVEAMAVGLPVIAAATPGNCEVGGPDILTFRPDDPVTLADHIERLWRDPVAYGRQSRRSLDVSSRYSWAACARRMLETLKELSALPHGIPRS